MSIQTGFLPLVLVAFPAGVMRNALISYLYALAVVEVVACDTLAALRAHLAAHSNPLLVIIDFDLNPTEMFGLLRELRLGGVNTLALVGSLEQQLQCLAAGASQAVPRGFVEDRLHALLARAAGPQADITAGMRPPL